MPAGMVPGSSVRAAETGAGGSQATGPAVGTATPSPSPTPSGYTAPVCDTDPAGPHPCGHGSTNRDTQELCAGLTESQVRQEQPERDSLQKSKREKGI